MAAGAVAHLASLDGQRSLPVDSEFFTGHKQTAIGPSEVLVSTEIPFSVEVTESCTLGLGGGSAASVKESGLRD